MPEVVAAGRRPRVVLRRQAARRSAGRHRRRARPTWSSAWPRTRSTARCGSTSSPWRRSRRRSTPTRRATRSRPSPRCAMLTEPLASIRRRARRAAAAAPAGRGARARRGARRDRAPRSAAAPCRPSSCRPSPSPSARRARPAQAPRRGAAPGPAPRRSAGSPTTASFSTAGRSRRPRFPLLARHRSTALRIEARRRRHRRAHRPRQDLARQGADRHRHRPAARGEGARHHHRSRLRLPRGARRPHDRDRRRARPRALRQEHAGRRGRHRPGAAGHRRRRGRDAPDARAPRDLLAAAHQARHGRADQDRSRRAGLARAGAGGRGARCSSGTFLAGCPIVPVSVEDGAGARRAARRARASWRARCPPGPPDQTPRLPIDRVFTSGASAPSSPARSPPGALAVDDRVEVYPRGVESQGARAPGPRPRRSRRASAGQRTARQPPRASSGRPSSAVTWSRRRARSCRRSWPTPPLELLADAPRPLKVRDRVRFHVGTQEVMARVLLVDRAELEPGQVSYGRFRLEAPIVALPGDRYVIRSYSPIVTIGGGTLLDIAPPRFKRKGAGAARAPAAARPGHAGPGPGGAPPPGRRRRARGAADLRARTPFGPDAAPRSFSRSG